MSYASTIIVFSNRTLNGWANMIERSGARQAELDWSARSKCWAALELMLMSKEHLEIE